METITIQKAKARLSRLIKKACQVEEVVIARGSKPVVRLVAIRNQNEDRKPGAWKGKIKIGPEFFEPLPPEELEKMGVAALLDTVRHPIPAIHC